jgi:hypothetical protein
MIDDGDCGAIGGIKIGRGSRSTRIKPAPVPLCPPQIPHDQTRAWIRAAAVGSQRLTAWAMARLHLRVPELLNHLTDSSDIWYVRHTVWDHSSLVLSSFLRSVIKTWKKKKSREFSVISAVFYRFREFCCDNGSSRNMDIVHTHTRRHIIAKRTSLSPSVCHLVLFRANIGLVVRVPGYRSWGPGLDSRRYQIFWEVVGLERGPLSLVRILEELLEWKSSGSGLGNRN